MGKLTIPQFNISGEKASDFKVNILLPEKVNTDLLTQAIKVHLINVRQGTVDTKTKGEVRGGGRKPWKQKGTGRARQGSTRSPHWRHGGIAHGPKPYEYEATLTKKMSQLAFKMSLLDRLHSQSLAVLEGDFEKPKTSELAKALATIVKSGKLTLVVSNDDHNLILGAKNLAGVRVQGVGSLGIYDIISAPFIVFSKTAARKVFGI